MLKIGIFFLHVGRAKAAGKISIVKKAWVEKLNTIIVDLMIKLNVSVLNYC